MSVQLQNMLIGAFLALPGGVILKIFGDAWSERSRQRLRCSVQWFDFESLNRKQLEDLFKVFDVDAVIPNDFFVSPRLFRVKVENTTNNEACEIEFQWLIPLTQVRLYVVGSAVPHPCGDCPVL
jgi:hypothetical protein